VSREVAANGGRDGYRAWRAHRRARERARRPKAAKLDCPRLAAQVTRWLEQWWSPAQISARLRIEHPRDQMMQVSHETIYRALYVQGRGELRRELARCLRAGRAARRPRGRDETRGKLAGMVMISDRPAEAADRAVPGHWEGDLILGKNSASAVGTLVERATRYVLLLHLPEGRDAHLVEQAMRQAITALPAHLARTITWDQGKEMARHAAFTIATGIPVYFCDPHSPWQRGTNENTNGLLRQYLPKGTDLSLHSAQDLARIAASLNDRPRKTLGFMKPSEKLAELLAHTD
jgi:IS30 family transposase